MSFLNLGEYEETSGGDILAAGKYEIALFQWELKTTAKGGKGLNCQFVVTNGPAENRRLFNFFNTQNPNPQAVSISAGHIKQWVGACGRDANADLTEEVMDSLIGARFVADVGIRVDKSGQYGDSNAIKKYISLADGQGQIGALAPAPRAPSAPPPAPARAAPPPPMATATAPPAGPATAPPAPPAAPSAAAAPPWEATAQEAAES